MLGSSLLVQAAGCIARGVANLIYVIYVICLG